MEKEEDRYDFSDSEALLLAKRFVGVAECRMREGILLWGGVSLFLYFFFFFFCCGVAERERGG